MNLTAQIAAYEEQKKAKMPSDILDVMNQTTELLVSKHIADKALRIGDKVADFTLPDQNGKAIKLSNLLAKGPIVVSFYRGGWCPYCNLELKAFNALLPDFKAHGAELIAISPQLPDSSLDTVQKNALEFTVLSDVGNKIAEQFGLVFTLDERLKPIYAKLGLDLPKSNGDDSYQLPLPSTYVINQRAEVAYAFVSEDYTQRAEPNDVLNLLKEINK
ncbi:MAG: peroxiredoxin-like family protein [Pseudoalteromonas sp.]|uniref:peroxiredoxin-like family protein n=1 Tax=unclassified Pseudoalteromonas TaxID=194690 RepID=UPI003F9D758F